MALEEDPSGAICFLVSAMSRFPFVLLLTALASLGFLTTACAERPQAEQAPVPSTPIEPPASAAALNPSAKILTGLKLQKMNDLRRPHMAKPPASIVEQPIGATTLDASTK